MSCAKALRQRQTYVREAENRPVGRGRGGGLGAGCGRILDLTLGPLEGGEQGGWRALGYWCLWSPEGAGAETGRPEPKGAWSAVCLLPVHAWSLQAVRRGRSWRDFPRSVGAGGGGRTPGCGLSWGQSLGVLSGPRGTALPALPRRAPGCVWGWVLAYCVKEPFPPRPGAPPCGGGGSQVWGGGALTAVLATVARLGATARPPGSSVLGSGRWARASGRGGAVLPVSASAGSPQPCPPSRAGPRVPGRGA